MKEIFFNEELHKYTNSRGDVYKSATQFIELFIIPFEKSEKFWLIYKAIQYLSPIHSSKIKKYSEELDYKIGKKVFSISQYNRLISYALGECDKDDTKLRLVFSAKELSEIDRATVLIKEHWENVNAKSKRKGTAIHLQKEKEVLRELIYLYRGEKIRVHSDMEVNLKNMNPGVYSELRLWNHFFRIAGTSDQVIVKQERRIVIRDYKTNLELVKSNPNQRMKPPVQHLEDCNFNHYTLQLSLYAWMLEQMGYIVEYLEIEHFEIEEYEEEKYRIINSTIYPLEYKKFEIESMLNFYRYGHDDF